MTATVRYLVSDVAQSVAFYTERLGFEVVSNYGAMAILRRGDLDLWLAGPSSSAARPMPDGRAPEPGGGWGRFVVTTDDLDGLLAGLREAGCSFRNDVVTGPGGRQILLEDPSGNVVELFQPA